MPVEEVDAPPPCEVCGSTRHTPVYALRFDRHPGEFRLNRCHGCGLVFNWPRLPDTAVHDQYDGDYYVFSEPPARRWNRAVQLYVQHLLPLERAGQRRTLLDIGCSRGELLALARERGWTVTGIELSSEAAQQAQDDYDLDVRVGTIEDHAASLTPFDTVISNDVIEHVLSPRDFLQCVRQVVARGGCGIIETPNWGSAWRRIGRRRWLGLNRFHIYLFDAQNLPRLMTACGFRDCHAVTSTHSAYAAWGVRPELAPALSALPAGIRWRAEATLNRLTPSSLAMRLRAEPPPTLDAALRQIDDLAREKPSHASALDRAGLGDNLAVIGHA